MNPMYLATAMLVCFANDNDAYIPEKWANEGLAILEEKMIMANLVHRDFESDIREFGDVVNTRRPAERTIRRRTDNDDYVAKDVSATNVRVPLDQWFYDSFIIKDGEASKSFQDLVTIHLQPCMVSIARAIDRTVLGQVHRFLKTPSQRVGRLGAFGSANAKDFVIEAGEVMDNERAYEEGRKLLVSSNTHSGLLKTDIFIKANERGDSGSALEQARVGTILNFDVMKALNIKNITTTNADIATGTVTNALAAGGSGSQAVTITGYQVNVGEYATVAGNDQPAHITAATVGGGNTTAVTLNEANKYATLAAAVITAYKKCDVKGAFDVGHSKEITVDGHTASKPPQVGQLISFGTGASRKTYMVIEATVVTTTETNLLLDRPLDAALADNDLAFPGPAGSMNLAFHRDAIALVTRPHRTPDASLGVRAAVAAMNGLGLNVTMQYDSTKGGTRVNFGILAGVALLDEKLATLVLG